MEWEENKIIAAFKKRDANALAHLFRLHYRPLCFFAEGIVNDRQEAEDIVSNVFMRLWSKHTEFESFASIKNYLYVAVRNGCFDFLKHLKHVSAHQKEAAYLSEDQEAEILHLMMEAELWQELVKEIESLPTTPRRIVELSFLEGLDSKQVSEQLGLSVKTVRNEKARAVQLIKAVFLKRKLLYVVVLSLVVFAERITHSFH